MLKTSFLGQNWEKSEVFGEKFSLASPSIMIPTPMTYGSMTGYTPGQRDYKDLQFFYNTGRERRVTLIKTVIAI